MSIYNYKADNTRRLDKKLSEATEGTRIIDFSRCECHLDCHNCSHSGDEFHLHNDEACPIHPNAPVVS